MSDEITLRVYRTSDLTQAAALWSLGHTMHHIDVDGEWATFVIGYEVTDEELQAAIALYEDGHLLVDPREFARRRNELAAMMRRSLAEAGATEGAGRNG